MILVVLRSHPGVHAKYGVQERCLRESGCKVVRLAKLLFADTLQLFTDLSDNIL